jgi:hypothetical protein
MITPWQPENSLEHNMIGRTAVFSLVLFVAIAGLAGCGLGNGSVPPSITPPPPTPTSVLFIQAPPASLAVNAQANVYAATIYSAAGSNENSAVTYSLSCASPNACGTLTPSDEAGAVDYTAPSAIPSGSAVTITATSVANTALTRSASVTILPPIPISVSFFATLPASLQVNASIGLSANIQNDTSANPQVKWTVTCGSASCGSFSSTTTGSENPTTYTAPPTIPMGNTVTIMATSVTDPTKSVSGSIVITAAAPTLANGSYVFQIAGSSVNQASFITGVLVAQNGAITGGEQDAVSDNGDGPYSSFGQIIGGSYATTPDGNLAITIQVADVGPETLNGTLASGQKGYVAGIDGTLGTGTLDLQTATSAPSGGYAISLDAGNLYDDTLWIAGVVNVDSPGGISGMGSILDVNAGSAYFGGTQMLGASTVSAPDAFGRVLFTLNPGANSTIPVLYVAGYEVDANHMRLVEVGDANNSFVVPGINGGAALAQATATGSFTGATVAGTTYVFGAEGEDGQGILQMAGVLTLNAGGSAIGMLNWNDLSASAPQNPVAFTGSYSVDPTGRVTLTNLTDGATFKYSMHLYLDGQGGGLVLSNDEDDVFAGQVFEQQAAAFTGASFNGNYGMNASADSYTPNGLLVLGNAVGPLTATANSGADDVAGYADQGAGLADFAISGSFTPAANGVFTGSLAGFDTKSPAAADPFTLYLVDSTQGIAIETDNAQLTLARFGLVQ